MHHGGHFTGNLRKYVGGAVDVVDNCDLERWSKVEIEGMRRDFRYTSVSRLWYKMPEVDQEIADFHLVVDGHVAMYMTKLVRGIHFIPGMVPKKKDTCRCFHANYLTKKFTHCQPYIGY